MSPVQKEGPAGAGAAATRRSTYLHQPQYPRDETPLEHAVDDVWEEAETFVKKVPKQQKETLTYAPELTNALFCGHIMADLDSIAGAIGAAHLYGGTPARASDINSETVWALEKWGCTSPEPIEALLKTQPDANVCLVDFQQQSQLNPVIPMRQIVGIIDHHALQSNTIVTEGPIFVDIRPWGCMSSILAHSYAVQETHLPKNIAGMLLSAILSDTLNLRSPTTTVWDERMVSMLVQYLDIDDVNMLAAHQFRAKSHELSCMSPYQLVNGDMKTFKFTAAINYEEDESKASTPAIYAIGYGVIETTDADASMARIRDLIPEMVTVREETNLTAYFLAVVDIVHMTSTLLICGPTEASLAVAAYGGSVVGVETHAQGADSDKDQNNQILQLVGLVSRKKDFIPPLTRAVASGWHPPAPSTVTDSPEMQSPRGRRHSTIVMDYAAFGPGRLERIFDDEEDEIALQA
jgi:manganese-dependent inorganic pyrophosphatase